MTVEVL